MSGRCREDKTARKTEVKNGGEKSLDHSGEQTRETRAHLFTNQTATQGKFNHISPLD